MIGIIPPIVIKVSGTEMNMQTTMVAISDKTDLRNIEMFVLNPS